MGNFRTTFPYSYLSKQIGKTPQELSKEVLEAFREHPTFAMLEKKREGTSFGEILEVTKTTIVLDDGKGDELILNMEFVAKRCQKG